MTPRGAPSARNFLPKLHAGLGKAVRLISQTGTLSCVVALGDKSGQPSTGTERKAKVRERGVVLAERSGLGAARPCCSTVV